jgi:hypothetical protein
LSVFSSKLTTAAPGLAAGLFAGRVLSELWAKWNGNTTWWLAVIITFLCLFGGVWSFRRLSLQQSWPFLLLLIYVFYPENNLPAAGLVALVAILTWWQINEFTLPGPKNLINVLFPTLLLFSCFVLYIKTLAPDILPADNGEFQLVAANLGVAHPPGFPLYTMLAHLMTWLPFGLTPAYRVNLFSAVTSTLTLAAIYISLFKLTRRILPTAAATLILATATTFWAQATMANIRSMTALFAALMFLSLVLFYEEIRKDNSHQADRFLILFGLTFGLGITHHASLVFLGLVAVLFILILDRSLLRTPARWWRPILAFLIGMLPLLYLPLRATADVRGASPSLATLAGFLEHALATGFRGDLFVYFQPLLFLERLRIMGNVLTFQFSTGVVVILALSLILLAWQEWRLAFLFGSSALLFTFITATYRAPQTVEYMLPAYVALALVLGAELGGVNGRLLPGRTAIWSSVRCLLTAFVIVMALSQLASRFESYSHLSKDFTARDYANTILIEAPQNALLLANWHWATPIWYLQEVEGVRPDIDVRYVFPEGEPYPQTWARRVSEGLTGSRDVITTNFDGDAFATLPISEPFGDAFLFRQEPRRDLPANFNKFELTLGGAIHILGFEIESPDIALTDEAVFTLAWQPINALEEGTTLFAHLVAADGSLAGQQDIPIQAQEDGITFTQFRLSPFTGTKPGQFQVLLGAYAQEPLLTPDNGARTAVTQIEIKPAKFAPATSNPLQRRLLDGSERRLVGFDNDNSLPNRSRLYLHWQSGIGYASEVFDNMIPTLPTFAGPWGLLSNRWQLLDRKEPAYYVPLSQGITWTGNSKFPTAAEPGQELVIRHSFLSALPVLSDQVVSMRLIGFEEDGYHWGWWDLDDTIPAMGAIPTLKWIAGSQVTSPHFVTIDESAEPAQEIGGALTLYDAFTGRVLPILDNRLAGEFGWIPLNQRQAK